MTSYSRMRVAMVAAALFFTAGCGPADTGVTSSSQPAAEAGPRSTDFGDFELHYSAITTDTLPSDVARVYGIQRSKTRAMLNVVILRKQAGSTGQPVPGTVTANTRNLTGQLKTIAFRRVDEENAVYYIAELPVANRETLIFDITAIPEGETNGLEVRFQQQFYAE